MFRKGLLVVISGPSGTGKGTVLKLVKESFNNVRFSVSATTRKPREGEVEGKNYFFKTVEEFKEMLQNNEMIEWVEYCDNYYGTPRKYIEESMEQGYDVILELEVEGAINIKNQYPDSVTIFMVPPSFDELRLRIEGRGTEKPEVIEKRLNRAKEELSYIDRYDYITINNTVEDSVSEVKSIIVAEKLKYQRNKDIIKELGIETGGNEL